MANSKLLKKIESMKSPNVSLASHKLLKKIEPMKSPYVPLDIHKHRRSC
jgi:hypothetical protein